MAKDQGCGRSRLCLLAMWRKGEASKRPGAHKTFFPLRSPVVAQDKDDDDFHEETPIATGS